MEIHHHIRGYNPEDLKLAVEIAEQTYKKFRENGHPDIDLITVVGIGASATVDYMKGVITDESYKEIGAAIQKFLREHGF